MAAVEVDEQRFSLGITSQETRFRRSDPKNNNPAMNVIAKRQSGHIRAFARVHAVAYRLHSSSPPNGKLCKIEFMVNSYLATNLVQQLPWRRRPVTPSANNRRTSKGDGQP